MDLSYFNARVRGRMGRLFREPDYAPLFATEGPAELIDRLRSSAYGPRIETASARFDRADEILSSAVNDGLASDLKTLWEEAPEEARPLLKAVVVEWEVFDLKAIVRGIARSVKREEIQRELIPAGEFDSAALRTLLTSEDVPGVVGYLDTWGSPYAAPLKEGMELYRKRGSTGEMELRLDLHAFSHLLRLLKKEGWNGRILEGIISLRIDARNITTILKIAGEGYSEEGAAFFFIEGGRSLKKKDFLRLSSAKARDEALKGLVLAVKDEELRSILSATEANDLYDIEERLEDIAARRLKRLSVVEPLSIAPAASFVQMKAREIRNLRIIERGKSFGIPEEELKRLVRYPL